jgi:prephenate dehydrogenase
MGLRQISIIGVGLLGGSLGLAVKRRQLAGAVVGIGHRESTLRTASARGAIDRFTLDVAEGVRGADLVVLATPVGLFGPLLEQAAPALAEGCLVTDVGSTKRAVLEAVLPRIPKGCNFVGAHPLAGSEARGIDAARADLYDEALVFVVPTERSDEAAVKALERFWRDVGARVRRIDAETHDRLLAESSHLPHLVAAALMNALSVDAEQAIGRGFLDTTRVASGDPAMWRDILLTNRDQVLRALAQLEAGLGAAKSALEKAQAEAIGEFLEQAKSRRDRLRGA